MKILLSQAHVAVTGTFKSFASRDAVVSKLLMAGAEGAGRKRTDETNLVVVGCTNRRPIENNLEKTAKVRGIPVLDELQLKVLLREGEVEVDDDEIQTPGEGRLSELVAQARGVLDGALSSARWSSLIELVDGCAPEELGGLVDYLAPQLDRWRASDRHVRWHIPRLDALRTEHSDAFFDDLMRGEVRVAPPGWLFAAARGDDARLRLASHVSLSGLGLKARAASAILKSSCLGSMRVLDLTGAPVARLGWPRIVERARWLSLKTVRLGALSGEEREAFGAVDAFPRVTRLCVRTRRHGDIEDIARTLSLPMFDEVEAVVTCSDQDIEGLARALESPGVLPSLTTWEAESMSSRGLQSEATQAILWRIERMSVMKPRDGQSLFGALGKMSFEGLTELDLSGLMPRLDEGAAPGARVHARSILKSHLQGSALIRSVPRLVLGELVTGDLRALLEAEGVEVA